MSRRGRTRADLCYGTARELLAQFDALCEFAAGSAHPAGGFGQLDTRGHIMPREPRYTYSTARMTHTFALAYTVAKRLNRDADTSHALCMRGLQALETSFSDPESGGWFGAIDPAGRPQEPAKNAYTHAHVLLAAASATQAGITGADDLLDKALAIVEDKFWDAEHAMLVDNWDRRWERLDAYRGANANMHGVEAMLAAADALQPIDPTRAAMWRERALSITTRIVGHAAGLSWRLPEHFDATWTPDLSYNKARPHDQFRPYGVTPGHQFEWARLCVAIHAALAASAPEWLLPAAKELFAAAAGRGWRADGHDGFVYTLDWSDGPVALIRPHWVICEALSAAAALHASLPRGDYGQLARIWWSYALSVFDDPIGGSWHHEVDASGRPSNYTWSGKPDAYHLAQALLAPMLQASSSYVKALQLTGPAGFGRPPANQRRNPID